MRPQTRINKTFYLNLEFFDSRWQVLGHCAETWLLIINVPFTFSQTAVAIDGNWTSAYKGD